MDPQILKKLHSYTIESISTGCIADWYGNCLASDHKALHRVVRTVQYITGADLPAIQDLSIRRQDLSMRLCQRKALKMVKDSSQSSHRLHSLLPHAKQYRCTKSGTNRTRNSFYTQAIRLLNSLGSYLGNYLL